MILTINKGLDEWKKYPLISGSIKIGSGGNSDIILSPTGVAKHHSTIHIHRNKIFTTSETFIS